MRGGSPEPCPRRVPMLIGKQKMRHGRHERVGEDVGGDHREDHRHRERAEEIARHPAEREQRHEGDADAKQGDRRRRHDLLGAAGDGGQNVLAMLLHVAVDVLDRDGRVVDQNADRQRQAAERHDVDGLAEHGQRGQRTEHGQRDRNRDDQGRAPAAEKDEDHQSGERGRDQSFAHDRGDGRFDELGLVSDEGQVDPGREGRFDRRQARLDAVDDVERGCGADLEDRHQDALAPVELNDIGLRRRAVMDVGDVAHEHDRAVDHLDRQIVEVRDRLGQVIEVDGEFVGADFLGADRIDLVLQGERIADIDGGKIVGAQRALVEIDLHLARGAAIGVRELRARHSRELRPDKVLRKIEQLRLGQRIAGQSQLDDRNARGVVDQNDRRRGALGKLLQNGLRYRRDLRLSGVDVDIRLKEDFDDAHAGKRLRLDMLDIVDGGRTARS